VLSPGGSRRRCDHLVHGGAIQVAKADVAIEVRQREVHQQPPVLAARASTNAVLASARTAIKPRQAEHVQGGAAPPRTDLAVALQRERASGGHRVGRLRALPDVDAKDHDELRPTPIDPRYVGRLQWQHHQCWPVATAVATRGRSSTAKNPHQSEIGERARQDSHLRPSVP
jgi:hypothetical protein